LFPIELEIVAMAAPRLLAVLVLSLVPTIAFAATTEWRKYVIPSIGTNGGSPEGGTGRRFFTKDHRADLTVQSILNLENDSPATFLSKKRPPADKYKG
jgi:hypothetical protein